MEDIASYHDGSARSSSHSLLVGTEKAVDFGPDEAKARRRFLPWTAHMASVVLFLGSLVVFMASGKSDMQCVERQASWCIK